ncbi:heavy-metal-associated domain-containing protein [Nitrosococcus halophilus]|uniref:heavy-metal-associated domain-containing protein n=1 Tax=Nitrosococcus halophilus TaxID=133539 RepID=UPI0023AF2789|nr:heavy-metal-associated domain-containing protein [Nitrosococcus halophilus]
MVASVSTILLNSFLGRLLPKPREAQCEQSEVHTLELHIPSMHCESCLNAITQAVTQFPEVLEVQGDLKKKIVSIRYQEDHAAPDRIRRVIDEVGFPAG